MSEPKQQDLGEIEALLATRQKLLGWLDRLDDAGSRAPKQVRAKVQADYRARLSQVVAQLSNHSDVITSSLTGLRAQSKELRRSRTEEDEVRAEAELRHAVGEYTDDEWQLVELESSGKIEEFDGELDRLAREIGRLEEVSGLITPETMTTPEPGRTGGGREDGPPETEVIPEHFEIQNPPVLEDAPSLQLVRDPEPIIPQPKPEAPRFVPRGGAPKPRESGPSRAIPFPPPQQQASASAVAAPGDELAFLRSVTIDSPSRPSPQPTQASEDHRPIQPMAKTLKCSECGSLNRPTEWYCERCGAELAAL